VATDQQFESTIERIVASLRAEMASAFERHAAEVAQKTAAEREATIRAATDAVRKETQEQIQQVRRAAHDQIEAAKRTAQTESAARVRAEAQVEDVRRIGRSQVEDVQRTMSDRVLALTRELDESRRETAARRQELDSARSESSESLSHLVRGLHAVDEAESLSAVLQRLIDASQPHANGASVLIVRPDGLREWGSAGFNGRTGPGERATAVATSAATERRQVESESAIAFPVNVGGDVVAVLYAEVGDALSPQRRIAKDALDALTRHAGRVLETITVQQAAGLRPVRRESASGTDHSIGERSIGERLS
jgi:hypothetical protein